MIGDVIQAARNMLGWRYSQPDRWANGAADCSSLVWRAYANGGLPLDGRTVNGTLVDYPSGPPVDLSQVQPGDLVYKNWDGNGYGHVGMSTGGQNVIEASSYYGVVERPNLDTWQAASRPYPELGGIEMADEQARADIAALSLFNQQRFNEIVGLIGRDVELNNVDQELRAVDQELRAATVELAKGMSELTDLLAKNTEADQKANEEYGDRLVALEKKILDVPETPPETPPATDTPGWVQAIADFLTNLFSKKGG